MTMMRMFCSSQQVSSTTISNAVIDLTMSDEEICAEARIVVLDETIMNEKYPRDIDEDVLVIKQVLGTQQHR